MVLGPAEEDFTMKWVVGLLFLLLPSCASVNEDASSEPTQPAEQLAQVEAAEPEGETVAELMPFFPAELMEDLIFLQSAIFYKYEESMAICMQQSGWEYPEPVLQIATVPEYQSQAEQLLATFLALPDGQSGQGGDQDQTMSAAAIDQEQLDFERCLEANEWSVSHPLAEGSAWLEEAYNSANERTNADETWRESKAEANACFEAEGYGTLSEVAQTLDAAFVEIAVSERNEQASPEQTIADLEALIAMEAEMNQLNERCFAAHNALTSELYHSYLNDEVSGSPELQAELAQMQETVDRYRDVLDELRALE